MLKSLDVLHFGERSPTSAEARTWLGTSVSELRKALHLNPCAATKLTSLLVAAISDLNDLSGYPLDLRMPVDVPLSAGGASSAPFTEGNQ
jgi:hypothetical protein